MMWDWSYICLGFSIGVMLYCVGYFVAYKQRQKEINTLYDFINELGNIIFKLYNVNKEDHK